MLTITFYETRKIEDNESKKGYLGFMEIIVPQTAESSHLSMPIKHNLDLHTTIVKKMKDLNFTYHCSTEELHI